MKLGRPTTSSRSNETRLADPRKYAPRKQLSKLTENSCSQGKSSASVNEKPHKGAAKSCLIFSAERTNPTSSWDCVDCKLVYTESDDNWVQCIFCLKYQHTCKEVDEMCEGCAATEGGEDDELIFKELSI